MAYCSQCIVSFSTILNPKPFPVPPDQDFCGSCGSSDPESIWPSMRDKWLCTVIN